MADTPPPSGDEPWYTTFDAVFWLTLSGSVFAFLAVGLRACLKSRCTRISCCGLEIERDVSGMVDTDDIKLDLSKTPASSRKPSSEFNEGRPDINERSLPV